MSVAEGFGFVHVYEPGRGPETLLLLHGTGGTEHDLVPLGRRLAPAAHLLAPRGKVLEVGNARFFRRLAPGVFDVEDVRLRAGELKRFVAAAASRYGLDPSRVWAVGYSNGANIAAALLLLHPDALAGAVLLRPVLPLEPDMAPGLAGKPVFIAAGRRDPLAPAEAVEALAEWLRRGGAQLTVRWQEAGHGLAPEELDAVRAWLAPWLHHPDGSRPPALR